MTTTTTTTVTDHTSDAGFRAWGLEFSTALAAIGLVQTADTGQINWTTVTRPGANTAAGYEIWRFADSTIYMKIEYGTGGSTTTPQMWNTAGTGSNGSGTITGQTSTRNIFTCGNAPTSTASTTISRWCRVADAFAVGWKEGFGGTANKFGGLLVVGKTVDGTGAATSVGFGVLRHAGAGGANSLSLQSVRTAATAATFNDSVLCALIPGNVSSSSVGGVFQAYDFWLNVPDVQPFNWANLCLIAEAGRGTSFSVAQVGSSAHTYAATGQLDTSLTIVTYPVATLGAAYIFE